MISHSKSGIKTQGSWTQAMFTMAEEDTEVTAGRDMKMSSCYECSMVFPSISSHWKRPELLKTAGEFYNENCTSGTPTTWEQVISLKKDFAKGQTVERRNMERMKRSKIVLYTDTIKELCWLGFMQRRLREWLHVGLQVLTWEQKSHNRVPFSTADWDIIRCVGWKLRLEGPDGTKKIH